MISFVIGALRVIGLRGLSWFWTLFGDSVLGSAVRGGLFGLLLFGLATTIYALWPSAGNPIEDAVREALGQRETITNINIDEEKRDNAWIEQYQKWQDAERAAAAKAPGADPDRVVFGADDPWLLAKRKR